MPYTSNNKIPLPSENGANNAVVMGEALQRVDDLFDGAFEFDLSGGNKTVDDTTNYTNNSSNGAWVLTGTLSANRVLVCPDRVWKRTVINNTTGSFSVTLSYDASDPGLVIPQGATWMVQSDGDDITQVEVSAIVASTDITDSTSIGRDILTASNASVIRSVLGLGTAATADVGTDVCELDGSGKVPSNRLPAIAISDTFVVSSQAAMLALAAQTGDIAKRTDTDEVYILKGSDPATLADWELLSVGGSGGSGDVTGPASSTTDAIALFSNTGGKVIKNSTVTMSSTGVFTIPNVSTAPSAPASGRVSLYAKGDKIYARSSAGTEYDLTVSSAGGLSKYVQAIGDGSTNTFIVSHNLGTRNLSVTVRNSSTGDVVQPSSISFADDNYLVIVFSTTPSLNQYTVTVIG